ncbi:hypothetical protein ES703_39054 [subsurface metagenome]
MPYKNIENRRECQKRWVKNNPEKRREQDKRYYQKHFERIKEYNKRYGIKNRKKRSIYMKQWRKDNPGKAKEADKRYRENNPEKIKNYRENNSEYYKQYYKNNLEKILERQKLYCKNNSEKMREYRDRWVKNNPEKRRLYINNYFKIKRKIDLKFSLNSRIKGMIYKTLRRNKNGWHWELLVGYNLADLKKRLNKTMPRGFTWKDFLSGELHIDHIIPIDAFNFTRPEHTDFKRCWALSNLRLLPAKENLSKHNHLDRPFQPALRI